MTSTFVGAWSMTAAERCNDSIDAAKPTLPNEAPGPGTYADGIEPKSSSPHWTLKAKTKNDSAFYVRESIPAPGQYEFPTYLKCGKPIKKAKDYPGSVDKSKSVPRILSGSYVGPVSSIDTRKGYFFGYRFEDQPAELSPGPTYNVNDYRDLMKSMKVKNKSSGFGFGAKNSIYKQLNTDTPGPGSYDQTQKLKSAVGGNILFPKKERALVDRTNTTLGPGSYEPNITYPVKGCLILGKNNTVKKDHMENIGPGSYKMPENKSPTAVRFVQSKRQDIRNGEAMRNPSPFDYNPKRYPEAYKMREGFKISSSERRLSGNGSDTPGPGTYNIGSALSKQGVTISSKLQTLSKNPISEENTHEYMENTNPKYEMVSPKAPAFSFPTQPLSFDKYKQPSRNGPGAYDITKVASCSEKFSIGKAARFKEPREDQICYFSPNIPSTVGQIPSYLLKNKKQA